MDEGGDFAHNKRPRQALLVTMATTITLGAALAGTLMASSGGSAQSDISSKADAPMGAVPSTTTRRPPPTATAVTTTSTAQPARDPTSTSLTPNVAAGQYSIIGLYPGPNTPTLDHYTLGAADACNLGNSQGDLLATHGLSANSYIDAMNAWQGKSSAVISCYYGVTSSLFTDQVPQIWDNFHAVPMLNLAEDPQYGSLKEVSYSTLQQFGAALGHWIVGTDSLGEPAPAGGRRIYIRWDWESNGTWYPYAPLYQDPATCSELANDEVTYVDRWQQVYNAIMSAASNAAGGMNLANNVAWVYSVNAMPSSISSLLPAALQDCPSTQGKASIYEPQLELPDSLDVTQPVTTTGTVAHPSQLEASLYPMNDYNGPDYNGSTQYVQWLGIDGYSSCTTETPSQVFGYELTTLREFSSLPVSVDEVSASVVTGKTRCPASTTAADKGSWLTQYMHYVQSVDIKMSVLFNDDTYEGSRAIDWAVFCAPSSENGTDGVCTGDSVYTSAAGKTYDVYSQYPEALASSYFIGSNASNPQVLSNAEFLGQ